MIMPAGQPLLLPVNPFFLWGSLIIALVVNVAASFFGNAYLAWLPDILAITLVFWALHQPARVGLLVAFVFGLLMDVHSTGLLGQTALSYAVMVFLIALVQRRLVWFSLLSQAVQILPVLAVGQACLLLIRLITTGNIPSWPMLLVPVFEALLWPILSLILLAPQRRPLAKDDSRPI